MTTKHTRLLLSAFAIGTLCGCQNILSNNQGFAATNVEDADLSGYFTQRLAEGRSHLQANRPGAAIVAYRQASIDPRLRARGFNGMAIAFDRLGRTDLAQRYFMAAIELEPQNEAFAQNFIHFNEARAITTSVAEALALAEAAANVTAESAVPELVENQAAETSGLIRRISEREVRIASQGEEPLRTARAAVINVEQRTPMQGRSNARYPVTFALSEIDDGTAEEHQASDRTAANPVRASRSARVAPPPAFYQRRSYPIRIRIRES